MVRIASAAGMGVAEEYVDTYMARGRLVYYIGIDIRAALEATATLREPANAQPICPNLDRDKAAPYDPTNQPFDDPLRHVDTQSRISDDYTQSEISDEEAEAIWRAAYDEWAEFGATDHDAGRAAYREVIAVLRSKLED
jgi:hypothetical protein